MIESRWNKMYILRELSRKDLTIINKWRNDPELIALLGAPFRYINMNVDEKWFEGYMGNRGNAIRCAIVEEDKDDILGLVSLVDINYINQSAVFHIMIGDKENQGKGIGTFAVQAMLEHAFFNMNLQRIELSVLESNERARNLYEKMGFSLEGVKRKAVYKAGEFKNMRIYSILKEEYMFENSGGGYSRLPHYCTVKTGIADEKYNAMKMCDGAFDLPVFSRKNAYDLFEKINNYAEFIVAYNLDILGYAAMYANDRDNRTAYISLIAVDKTKQGCGIGSSVLQACIGTAYEKGMHIIKLEVKKDNKKAIKFYERNGFTKLEDCSAESIYMQKVLE